MPTSAAVMGQDGVLCPCPGVGGWQEPGEKLKMLMIFLMQAMVTEIGAGLLQSLPLISSGCGAGRVDKVCNDLSRLLGRGLSQIVFNDRVW